MDGLIQVRTEIIGSGEVNAVDARELHRFLESKQDFSDWIKARIAKYDFVQGVDFISFHNSMEAENTYINTKEYTLSLGMAKELAMVERNKKGKQARQYFIECERMLKEVISIGQHDPDWLREGQATLRFGDMLGMPKHISISETTKRVRMLDGPDFTSYVGALPSSQNIRSDEMMLEPTPLGKLFGLSPQAMNQKLAAWGWQYKTGGLWEPSAVGSPHSYKHHWQKDSKSGYNLKWKVEAVKARMREE